MRVTPGCSLQDSLSSDSCVLRPGTSGSIVLSVIRDSYPRDVPPLTATFAGVPAGVTVEAGPFDQQDVAYVLIRVDASVVPSPEVFEIEATVSTAEGKPIKSKFGIQIREKADLLDGGTL